MYSPCLITSSKSPNPWIMHSTSASTRLLLLMSSSKSQPPEVVLEALDATGVLACCDELAGKGAGGDGSVVITAAGKVRRGDGDAATTAWSATVAGRSSIVISSTHTLSASFSSTVSGSDRPAAAVAGRSLCHAAKPPGPPPPLTHVPPATAPIPLLCRRGLVPDVDVAACSVPALAPFPRTAENGELCVTCVALNPGLDPGRDAGAEFGSEEGVDRPDGAAAPEAEAPPAKREPPPAALPELLLPFIAAAAPAGGAAVAAAAVAIAAACARSRLLALTAAWMGSERSSCCSCRRAACELPERHVRQPPFGPVHDPSWCLRGRSTTNSATAGSGMRSTRCVRTDAGSVSGLPGSRPAASRRSHCRPLLWMNSCAGARWQAGSGARGSAQVRGVAVTEDYKGIMTAESTDVVPAQHHPAMPVPPPSHLHCLPGVGVAQVEREQDGRCLVLRQQCYEMAVQQPSKH